MGKAIEKVSVVTGGTSGIGLETAKQLAEKGHEVIIVARNLVKGTQVCKNISASTGNEDVHFVAADLASQSQIREAAEKIGLITSRIDNLINNAGIWSSDREITEDGVEKVFAVNHLSFFLLSHLLYPRLSASEDARIINVSSDSHFKSKMFFDDLSLEKNYHGLRSYAQSKLANVLFTYHFKRLNPKMNISIYAVQPGLVKTDIGVKDTNWFHGLIWKIRRSGGVSAMEGASTSVYLATADEVKGISGKYWDNKKPKKSSERSYNVKDAEELWKKSLQYCNIDDYFHSEQKIDSKRNKVYR